MVDPSKVGLDHLKDGQAHKVKSPSLRVFLMCKETLICLNTVIANNLGYLPLMSF